MLYITPNKASGFFLIWISADRKPQNRVSRGAGLRWRPLRSRSADRAGRRDQVLLPLPEKVRKTLILQGFRAFFIPKSILLKSQFTVKYRTFSSTMCPAKCRVPLCNLAVVQHFLQLTTLSHGRGICLK